jgi:hypothetical protein
MRDRDEYRYLVEGTNTEAVQNPSLILAADRTHRRDVLDNFRYYKGGWNIREKHYLSVSFYNSCSVAFNIHENCYFYFFNFIIVVEFYTYEGIFIMVFFFKLKLLVSRIISYSSHLGFAWFC